MGCLDRYFVQEKSESPDVFIFIIVFCVCHHGLRAQKNPNPLMLVTNLELGRSLSKVFQTLYVNCGQVLSRL